MERARRWLLDSMQDYVLVCDLAGVDPHALRSKVRTRLR
jgi:hypothetical protein